MKLKILLLATALVALNGCASPMTPEQKALNKAYEAISSGKTAAGVPK